MIKPEYLEIVSRETYKAQLRAKRGSDITTPEAVCRLQMPTPSKNAANGFKRPRQRKLVSTDY